MLSASNTTSSMHFPVLQTFFYLYLLYKSASICLSCFLIPFLFAPGSLISSKWLEGRFSVSNVPLIAPPFAFWSHSRVQKKTTSMSLTIRSSSPKTPEALPHRSTLVQALSQPSPRVRKTAWTLAEMHMWMSVQQQDLLTGMFLCSRCRAPCPHCTAVRRQARRYSPRSVWAHVITRVTWISFWKLHFTFIQFLNKSNVLCWLLFLFLLFWFCGKL